MKDGRSEVREELTRAALQDLLQRDAVIAVEWLARGQRRAYSENFALQRQRAIAYIEWCANATDTLQRHDELDTAEFVRQWRNQAVRSEICDLPHRFRWVFASQALLAVATVLFVAGLPVLAMPLLAGAMFGALHIYLAAPMLIVGPDSAKVPQRR